MTNPRTEAGCGGPGNVSDTETRRAETTGPSSPSVPAQLRRRRVASWRLPVLPGGLGDPWRDRHPAAWSDAELDAWAAAVEQLRRHGLYAEWQLPESVTAALGRRSCTCRCRCPA